jgi:hypothetical protein
MKYYTICYPNEHNETVWETLSEDEILADYWDYWYGKMCEKYGKEHVDATYSRHECIDDWCIVHWAERNPWREMKENYE